MKSVKKDLQKMRSLYNYLLNDKKNELLSYNLADEVAGYS